MLVDDQAEILEIRHYVASLDDLHLEQFIAVRLARIQDATLQIKEAYNEMHGRHIIR